MVSLWPWKRQDNSPASFEKALSGLASKVSKSQVQLDLLRQRSRRLKVLWTLYTSFAYLVCVIILFLVVGWKNLGALEYTAVAGSPLVIYLIRFAITTYYNFRIDTVTQRLESTQAERQKTIDKLKAATKYDSTQELLEKYGGVPSKPKKQTSSTSTPSKGPKISPKIQKRTSTGPPPLTANIGRPDHAPAQVPSQSPIPQPILRPDSSYTAPSPVSQLDNSVRAEFAPNAFSAPPQYATGVEINMGGNWYDRVLDLLMGEDETLPKNRMVLICQTCRLVNGQAPPGTKSLPELGKWKCFGCGALNGEEDEALKAVQEMKERIEIQERPGSGSESKRTEDEETTASKVSYSTDLQDGDEEANDGEVGDEDEGGTDSAEGVVEAKARKGRPKGSRKK